MEFFQTVMGSRFYEGSVPRLVRTLERIATSLEKLVAVHSAPVAQPDPNFNALDITIGQVLRNNDGLCLDNDAERDRLTGQLVDRLTDRFNITLKES